MSEKARVILERGCNLYKEGKVYEAFVEFVAAARRGNPEAQINLANMFDAGEGVEMDFKKAVYWYKRAISKGSPETAYNLAITYRL